MSGDKKNEVIMTLRMNRELAAKLGKVVDSFRSSSRTHTIRLLIEDAYNKVVGKVA